MIPSHWQLQARIRLYMESSGCAMVILGVLIVFFSFKMRSGREQLRHGWRRVSLSSPAGFGGRRPSAALAGVPRQLPGAARRRPMTAGFSVVSRERGTSMRSMRWSRELAPDTLDGAFGSADEEAAFYAAPFVLDNLGANWTPRGRQHDELALAHQTAAIEAALSIVLTAATLIGFRAEASSMMNFPSDGKHERFCCLQHTVQVSLRVATTGRPPPQCRARGVPWPAPPAEASIH